MKKRSEDMTREEVWQEIHENMRKSERNLKWAFIFLVLALVVNVVHVLLRLFVL